ncbi:MAG: T9SS type A sorting domain-containing protein [Bacteroidota bacterium]|nr:T9SS type A sorting domain-containing protein [Bacteroidota bacterium]
MKKQIILIITVILLFLTINLSAQEFIWAKRAGLWGYDYGYGICSDGLGNVYVSGKYEFNAMFEDTTVGLEGNHDIFTAKYGPEGNLIWVRTAGGLWGDYAHAVACDEAGNVYVTGEIEQTAVFHGSNIELSSWGKNDVFVAKYNTEGVPLWAQRGGGGLSDKGKSIAISDEGVYATGYFRETASFNNSGDVKIESAGAKDIFIVGYDLNGNLKWLKRGGGEGDDDGGGITTDADGFIYVAGHFDKEMDFEGVKVTSNGGRDAYLAKFAPSGDLVWVKNEGGSSYTSALGVIAAKDGRIYMTGSFSGKVIMGNSTLSSNGKRDIFIACFTNDGQVQWAKNAGGGLDDVGMGIAADDDSNVYITGFYGESAEFNDEVITGVDSSEIFIAKYDSNGEFKWVMKGDGKKDNKFESNFEEAGRSIWVDKKNFVLVTGSFRENVIFGPHELQGWTNTNIFVAKIKQDESDESPYETGVMKNNLNNYFKIYPNPSEGILNIDYSGTEPKDVKFRLESLQGKILLEKQYKSLASGNEVLMLNDIAKGIYFLQIFTDQEHFVQKLIIK